MLYHIAKVCPLLEYPRTAHQMLLYLSLIRIDNQKKTKYCQAQLIGHFEPLLPNKFFDPSTPSMRKGREGEKKMERQITVKIVATNVDASRPPNGDRLQCQSLVPI